jgi:hypothetical protein
MALTFGVWMNVIFCSTDLHRRSEPSVLSGGNEQLIKTLFTNCQGNIFQQDIFFNSSIFQVLQKEELRKDVIWRRIDVIMVEGCLSVMVN